MDAPGASYFRISASVAKVFSIPPVKTVNKTILFYNDFHGDPYWNMKEGSQVFEDLNCPVKDCSFTADMGKFSESSAVAFHVPRIGFPTPRNRPPGQVWLFYAWESPAYVNLLPETWRHQFNWSLTYHHKSGYYMPFGTFRKRLNFSERNWTAVLEGKSKPVAWFVSNCNSKSKRMEYVKRLSEVIPVDIWGGCGDNKCGYDEREKCMSIINETYKFYLGFENSFCEDYIGEKLFRYAMYDVVVVVRGGGNYSKVAPPNSYINAADYKSPEDLGQYLKYLDQNKTEYIKYLQWKNDYYAEELDLEQTLWCDICRDLGNASSRQQEMDPYDLWFSGNSCWQPTDL